MYAAQSCKLIGAAQPGTLDLNLQGPWTRRGNTGYWCIFRWPGTTATAVKVGTPVKRVTLLKTGEEFPFRWNPETGRLVICDLPVLPPDALCSVLKVEFESEPQRKAEYDLAAWLNG